MKAGYILSNELGLIKLSDNQKNNRSWTIVYIKKGVGMYLLDGVLRCLNEGDIVILPPRVAFSFDTQHLGDEYNINLTASVLRFDDAWLDTLVTTFPVLGEMVMKIKEVRNPLAVEGPKWIKLSKLLDQILSCPKEEQPVIMFAILSMMATPSDFVVIKSVQQCDLQDVEERKARIDRYLGCNYYNKVSLEDIARYVGMSRTYFSIFFKTHYNEGFSDYLTRLRVEKATVLLLNTDKQLPSIAAECGFKTVQYFTRAFKKVKGITPGVLRRRR
jgi:AraC-like DNA-binding protein